MAFSDEIRKRLQQQDAGPGRSRYLDPTTGSYYSDTEVNSPMSPEAQASQDSGVATGSSKVPATPTTLQTKEDPGTTGLSDGLKDRGFAQPTKLTTDTGGPQDQGKVKDPAWPSGPPLQLLNKPFAQQAETLAQWLINQGYPPGDFIVGGTSPDDDHINALITQINDPNTPPEQLKYLANTLSAAIQGRGRGRSAVTGDTFTWSSATGTAKPTSKTSGDFIAGLGGGGGGGDLAGLGSGPQVDPKMLQDLLAMLAKGGITDQQQATQEGQLISNVEDSTKRRRDLIANRLGGQGVLGGVAQDQLRLAGNEADQARAGGLATIRSNIDQLRSQNMLQALDGALRLAGIGSQERQQIAQLLTQRSIAQAQLAQGGEQFQQNLGLNAALGFGGQDLTARGQTMQLVSALINLESQVDATTRAQIQHLIDQFIATGSF